LLFACQTQIADGLSNLFFYEEADQPLPEDHADDEREHHGQQHPRGDELEEMRRPALLSRVV